MCVHAIITTITLKKTMLSFYVCTLYVYVVVSLVYNSNVLLKRKQVYVCII